MDVLPLPVVPPANVVGLAFYGLVAAPWGEGGVVRDPHPLRRREQGIDDGVHVPIQHRPVRDFAGFLAAQQGLEEGLLDHVGAEGDLAEAAEGVTALGLAGGLGEHYLWTSFASTRRRCFHVLPLPMSLMQS